MKRSQMINELIKHIEEVHQKMGGLLSPRMGITTILNKAEELGMLPPMQPIPEYSFQAPNEWEEENEEV